MRVVTWNMGCSFDAAYRKSHDRTWSQLLAWDPDVALIQETLAPPRFCPEERWVFTPFSPWPPGRAEVGTLVYSKTGLARLEVGGRSADLSHGQLTAAEVDVAGDMFVFASIHAITQGPSKEAISALGSDVSWSGPSLENLDLILHDLSKITAKRRFVVGGDLNAAKRFDDSKRRSSRGSNYHKWFSKARDAKWRLAHPKFHAGEERTIFRTARPGEDLELQIDHLFTDDATWDLLTSCNVLQVPYLTEFTDHAPLALEW